MAKAEKKTTKAKAEKLVDINIKPVEPKAEDVPVFARVCGLYGLPYKIVGKIITVKGVDFSLDAGGGNPVRMANSLHSMGLIPGVLPEVHDI